MLSIIICSRDPGRLQAVSESVRATVGTEHEIVPVDNAEGHFGICEAYNLGASRSRYPLLCFMHEDVVCHTDGWGLRVAEALADPAAGLIGVVGGTYMATSPSGYWIEGFRTNRIHQYQRESDGQLTYKRINPGDEPSADVVAVDGLWMCCRRDVWAQRPFDAATFPGFHVYDLDFSFGVRALGLEVRVVYDVLLEHLSYGTYDRAWAEAQVAFERKWRAVLPASTDPLSAAERAEAESLSARSFAQTLLRNGFSRTVTMPYVLRGLRRRPFRRGNAWIVRQALLGQGLDARIKRLLGRPSTTA